MFVFFVISLHCVWLSLMPTGWSGVGASSVVVGVQLGRANAEQSLAAKFLVRGAATSTRCHEAQMLLAAESPHILRCHGDLLASTRGVSCHVGRQACQRVYKSPGLFEAELDQSPKMRGTFRVIMVSPQEEGEGWVGSWQRVGGQDPAYMRNRAALSQPEVESMNKFAFLLTDA